MTDIPIYSSQGVKVDSFFINDTLEHVDGRVCKGDKHWYKGAGIPYTAHHIPEMKEGYIRHYTCEVFYIGECVTKSCFEFKKGVFMERFQPHFADWIGACGEKELQIVENLWELRFDKSAIEVHEWQAIADDQYYLVCDYPYGRTNYLQAPKPENLMRLIGYMLDNDWNFPWDKSSISDIHSRGLVTDVADVFKSSDLMHKLGTVYSILYSLGKSDPRLYKEFCERYMLDYKSHVFFTINALSLLMRHGVDIGPCLRDNILDTYRNTVKNFLIVGKNCGFCGVGSCKNRTDENQSFGELIREEYIRQAELQLSK